MLFERRVCRGVVDNVVGCCGFEGVVTVSTTTEEDDEVEVSSISVVDVDVEFVIEFDVNAKPMFTRNNSADSLIRRSMSWVVFSSHTDKK